MSSRLAVPGLEHPHGVVQVREQQRVDDEAGAVLHLHHVLAAVGGERLGGVDGLVGRGQRPDDLDEAHHRRRVEEVDAHHLRRALGGHGQLHHREGGGVGGEDALGLHDVVEAGEELLLHRQVLHHRLEHEVAVVQRVQVVGGGDPAPISLAAVSSSLPRSTCLASDFSSAATMASALACCRERRITSTPALAATSAMPDPMIPDPTMPSVAIVMGGDATDG